MTKHKLVPPTYGSRAIDLAFDPHEPRIPHGPGGGRWMSIFHSHSSSSTTSVTDANGATTTLTKAEASAALFRMNTDEQRSFFEANGMSTEWSKYSTEELGGRITASTPASEVKSIKKELRLRAERAELTLRSVEDNWSLLHEGDESKKFVAAMKKTDAGKAFLKVRADVAKEHPALMARVKAGLAEAKSKTGAVFEDAAATAAVGIVLGLLAACLANYFSVSTDDVYDTVEGFVNGHGGLVHAAAVVAASSGISTAIALVKRAVLKEHVRRKYKAPGDVSKAEAAAEEARKEVRAAFNLKPSATEQQLQDKIDERKREIAAQQAAARGAAKTAKAAASPKVQLAKPKAPTPTPVSNQRPPRKGYQSPYEKAHPKVDSPFEKTHPPVDSQYEKTHPRQDSQYEKLVAKQARTQRKFKTKAGSK